MTLHPYVFAGTAVFSLCLFAGRGEAQNINLEPTYGSIRIDTGFMPDPHVKSLIAGGNILTRAGGVNAYIADPPDYQLHYKAGDKYALTIFAISDADTTLLVHLPNGKFVAIDDAKGKLKLNPALHFAAPLSGRYDIWVGTFGPKPARAKLYVTERIAKKAPNVAGVDPDPNPKSDPRPKVNEPAKLATSGKVYRTPKQLFADMPRSAYPKAGPEGGIERAAARKWLEGTFHPSGRVFEFPAKVNGVSIRGDDPFEVTITLDCRHHRTNTNRDVWTISEPFTLGDQKCKLMLQPVDGLISREELESPLPRKIDGLAYGPTLLRIVYNRCTVDEARMLRSLKGKRVTMGATIRKTNLLWKRRNADFSVDAKNFSFTDSSHLIFAVQCRPITIDGFLPAALRPRIREEQVDPSFRD